jgi:hypothetical protein
MFGWANIRNQNLFVGVLSGEIFFFEFGGKFRHLKTIVILENKILLFINSFS